MSEEGLIPGRKNEVQKPIEWGFRSRGPVEWKTMVLKFGDLTFDMKCNIESGITTALNDGWYFSKEIICPPYVTLVFWRQKEANND